MTDHGPDPAAVLAAWLAGPHSEASGVFSADARYHYQREVAAWLAHTGEPWRPVPARIAEWAHAYAGADRSYDHAVSAVRSFYRYCEDAGLVAPGTYLGLRRSASLARAGLDAPGRPRLTPAQVRALMLAAAAYTGPAPQRARVLVYLLLAGLRPGQITAMRLEDRTDEQHRVTWRVPQKNAAREATVLEEIPRDVVHAIDAYLPHRRHKTPHSTAERGPLVTSNRGRALNRMRGILIELRRVAATHPDLAEHAPELTADTVALSPSPFA